jgi:hypothetical protein
VIERGGKPIASLKPINEETDLKTLGELRALLTETALALDIFLH